MKTIPETTPFDAALFDFDGVLIESPDLWFAVMNAAAINFSAPPISFADFCGAWGQSVEEDAKQFFPGRTGDELAAYYNAHTMDYVKHLKVNGDARDVLQALRDREVPTGLLTNMPRMLADMILRHIDLQLDVVIANDDVARPKPAPDSVLLACQIFGVRPGKSLFIGDTNYDRVAANRAGVVFAGLGIDGDITLDRLVDILPLFGV